MFWRGSVCPKITQAALSLSQTSQFLSHIDQFLKNLRWFNLLFSNGFTDGARGGCQVFFALSRFLQRLSNDAQLFCNAIYNAKPLQLLTKHNEPQQRATQQQLHRQNNAIAVRNGARLPVYKWCSAAECVGGVHQGLCFLENVNVGNHINMAGGIAPQALKANVQFLARGSQYYSMLAPAV